MAESAQSSSNDNTTSSRIVNQGTGAGGANTNVNGLSFEQQTELKTEYTIVESGRYYKKIQFTGNDRVYKIANQANFFKLMGDKANPDVSKAHGCKNPDEAIIDIENLKLFIIEKKKPKWDWFCV